MNQILLVFAAIVLLGISGQAVSTLWLTKQQTTYSTEADITANALAQSIIEEAMTRRFDQNIPAAGDLSLGSLTAPNQLGVDGSEHSQVHQEFNDVDDYNGYKPIISSPDMGQFSATCKVYYVADTSPDVVSAVTTYYKRIDVKVTNKYISSPDTSLTVSRIVSFRPS